MTSTDRIQAAHVVSELAKIGRMLSDPLAVPEAIVMTIHAVQDPPPGDPGRLRDMAKAFDTAGGKTDGVFSDVNTLAGTKLPEAWQSLGGATAASVVGATANLIARVHPAFTTAATALNKHADTIEALRQRHDVMRQHLHEALRLTPAGGWQDLIDPGILGRLEHALALAVQAIGEAIGIYSDSLTASYAFDGAMGDLAGHALAAASVRGGQPANNAVLLANLTVSGSVGFDNSILSPAQAVRAGALYNKLSPADQARVDAMLANAKTPEEAAYILKAVAAGHSVDEVAAFDNQIHGRSVDWLREHLSLVDSNGRGPAEYQNVPFKQTDGTTCATASLVAARSMVDPLYALWLTTGGQPDNPDMTSGDAFKARLTDLLTNLHHQTNTLYPEFIGTSPMGVAGELNNHQDANGVAYDWHLVDDTDPGSVNPALRDAVTAVDQGHPVPVYIGETLPRHVVLLVGHDGDTLTFYEPTGGDVIQVTEQEFTDGKLDSLGFGHVQFVVTPKG